MDGNAGGLGIEDEGSSEPFGSSHALTRPDEIVARGDPIWKCKLDRGPPPPLGRSPAGPVAVVYAAGTTRLTSLSGTWITLRTVPPSRCRRTRSSASAAAPGWPGASR